MAKELDDIQLLATEVVKGIYKPEKVIPKFARFFADHGLDIVREDKERLGSAIEESPIRFVLVATLDHWAEIAKLPKAEYREYLPKLLELAQSRSGRCMAEPFSER